MKPLNMKQQCGRSKKVQEKGINNAKENMFSEEKGQFDKSVQCSKQKQRNDI